jgi:hypothetical protein
LQAFHLLDEGRNILEPSCDDLVAEREQLGIVVDVVPPRPIRRFTQVPPHALETSRFFADDAFELAVGGFCCLLLLNHSAKIRVLFRDAGTPAGPAERVQLALFAAKST